MQIEGTIVAVLPLEQGVSKSTGNPWSKATIVIEVGSGTQYPKKVALSNMKKAEEFIALPIGASFTFDIDVESREYQGRWFTNCNCFRWTPSGAQQGAPAYAPQPTYARPTPPPTPPQGNPWAQPQPTYAPQPPQKQNPQGDDGLPF